MGQECLLTVLTRIPLSPSLTGFNDLLPQNWPLIFLLLISMFLRYEINHLFKRFPHKQLFRLSRNVHIWPQFVYLFTYHLPPSVQRVIVSPFNVYFYLPILLKTLSPNLNFCSHTWVQMETYNMSTFLCLLKCTFNHRHTHIYTDTYIYTLDRDRWLSRIFLTVGLSSLVRVVSLEPRCI